MEGARLELGNEAQPSCRTRGEGSLWGEEDAGSLASLVPRSQT